jgi:CubicO group peptidase (beta-lactamase class C family)
MCNSDRNWWRFCVAGLVFFLTVFSARAQDSNPFPEATPESQGIPAASLKGLTDIVQGYVDDELIVGAELLIIKNRRTVLHQTIGWKDREEKIPMERNTIFNIRSMTKPITGTATQILAEEGKLRLDDAVARYIPAFDTDLCRSITIEQLLTHRSGLPLTILTQFKEFENLRAMAEKIGESGTQFPPGSKFWYSDAGTDVLGAVVEAVSGQSLDAFRTDRILMPLGMKDSFTFTDQNHPSADRICSLYMESGGRWQKFWMPGDSSLYPFAWGSQSIYSTPMDYARFIAMWLDEGRAGDRQILSGEAVSRMLTPVSEMTSLGSDIRFPTGFPGLEVFYGQMAILYGESMNTKPVLIGHNGSDGTFAWAWPGLDLMIFYFTQSRGQATGIRLETEIDRLLIHPEREFDAAPVPEAFKRYIGTYLANFGQFRDTEFTVRVQNNRLALDIPGQMVFELNEPDDEGNRTFVLTPLVSVSFHPLDSTAVHTMIINETATFARSGEQNQTALDSIPEQYRPFIGEFSGPAPGQVFSTQMQEGKLAVNIPNRGPLMLKDPDGKGRWFFDQDPPACVSFSGDSAGKITAMNLHQSVRVPRGKSAANWIEKVIRDKGIERALFIADSLKNDPGSEFLFNERAINALGYTLLEEKKIGEAVQIFQFNVQAYPESWNVYDSLGEAYLADGDTSQAVRYYRKSVEMNPDNEAGKKILETLGQKDAVK